MMDQHVPNMKALCLSQKCTSVYGHRHEEKTRVWYRDMASFFTATLYYYHSITSLHLINSLLNLNVIMRTLIQTIYHVNAMILTAKIDFI